MEQHENRRRADAAAQGSERAGAVFFDRDGTLNHDAGYLDAPDQVVLLPGVRETLRALKGRFLLFLFTNQSGVARGYFGMEAVEAVNRRLCELLGDPAFFDGICVAPEHPDAPVQRYRKPSPRYILETIAAHRLDPAQCYMVGDRKSDLEAGVSAGVGAIRVAADIDDPDAAQYCREHALATVADFREIASIILSKPRKGA